MSTDNPIKEEIQPSPENFNPRLLALINKLSTFQHDYEVISAYLRRHYGITNRGCGPSSFVLARMIHDEFNKLPIKACFGDEVLENDGIYIVHGVEKDFTRFNDVEIDHAWIIVRYQGQVAFISPESSHHTDEASFRGTIVYPKGLQVLYKEIGIRPMSEKQLLEHGITDEEIRALKGIMLDINSDKVPEMYKQWYETFETNKKKAFKGN